MVQRLAHPEWLPLLALAVAALGVALGLARLRARRRLRRLLGDPRPPPTRTLRSDAALWLAAAAIALALLGPRVGERVVTVPASGVDVMLLVDVSRSMDARDVPPSRLDCARRTAAQLLERLGPGDRAALAAFAGRGVLLTPLTPDTAALAELLEGLDTELIRPRSSRLGRGVTAALEGFEAGSERPRVLVVLSDGEDPERGTELGAALAARRNVRVIAVAFGSDRGATVPDHGAPLADAHGHVVVSRRDAGRLEALTSATGGRLFRADAWGSVAPQVLAAAVRRDAGSAPGALVRRRVRAVRVAPLAALAFGLLALEGLPRPRRRRRGLRRRAGAAALASASLAALLATPAPAGDARPEPGTEGELEAAVRTRPDDAALLIELGAARLERGRREAARRAFAAAAALAREPRTAALAYYDLGVAHLEAGELAAARDAFFDALAMAPRDERARFDLEWTLVALTQQPPSPGRGPRSARPQPEATARRDATAPPPGGPPRPPSPSSPPPLDALERQRLLERVHDDPAQALRSAVGGGSGRRGGAAPAW